MRLYFFNCGKRTNKLGLYMLKLKTSYTNRCRGNHFKGTTVLISKQTHPRRIRLYPKFVSDYVSNLLRAQPYWRAKVQIQVFLSVCNVSKMLCQFFKDVFDFVSNYKVPSKNLEPGFVTVEILD